MAEGKKRLPRVVLSEAPAQRVSICGFRVGGSTFWLLEEIRAMRTVLCFVYAPMVNRSGEWTGKILDWCAVDLAG